MEGINVVFPALEELLQLSSGCCCSIIIPEGYVYGPKLTIIIEPKPEDD